MKLVEMILMILTALVFPAVGILMIKKPLAISRYLSRAKFGSMTEKDIKDIALFIKISGFVVLAFGIYLIIVNLFSPEQV